MHRQCPKCLRSARELDRFDTDPKTNKRYLILYCGSCGFNFDLEEIPTPERGRRKGWFSPGAE